MSDRDDLITAAESGDAETLRRLLVTDRALASSRDDLGISALLHARYAGHSEAVSALLAAGPTTDIFDASAVGLVGRASELVGANPELVDAINVDGFRPLQLAAFFGHAQVVRVLLDAGASVSARSTNGMALQALHSAAASGHIGIVSMLLEAGADPNSEQVGGYTALDAADQIGDTELQAMLVAAGAER
jgi:ankyrin repeat protein